MLLKDVNYGVGVTHIYIDGLAQDCRNPAVNLLELPLYCVKPSICVCCTRRLVHSPVSRAKSLSHAVYMYVYTPHHTGHASFPEV